MRVGRARKAASAWVVAQAIKKAGFKGAFFSGSTIGQPDDAVLPATSDIDVVVVIEDAGLPMKLGKFVYGGALLEVTYLSWDQLASVEEVLTSYHLAGSFRTDTIIADPAGHLGRLQTEVSRRFAEQIWVRRRCENALQKVEHGLQNIDTGLPLHDKITSWLFPTGVTTHVLLVAALRNPTVRRRYLMAQDVLRQYEQSGIYEELLKLLGCVHMTAQRVEHHLEELARTFDAAAAAAKTAFFFSTDISAAARPIAIDGSRELIRSGYHREAVFWIVATFARCHKILAADAPADLQREHIPAFEALIADLGISSDRDLLRRAEDVIQFLPRLGKTAEAIMSQNPDILR